MSHFWQWHYQSWEKGKSKFSTENNFTNSCGKRDQRPRRNCLGPHQQKAGAWNSDASQWKNKRLCLMNIGGIKQKYLIYLLHFYLCPVAVQHNSKGWTALPREAASMRTPIFPHKHELTLPPVLPGKPLMPGEPAGPGYPFRPASPFAPTSPFAPAT